MVCFIVCCVLFIFIPTPVPFFFLFTLWYIYSCFFWCMKRTLFFKYIIYLFESDESLNVGLFLECLVMQRTLVFFFYLNTCCIFFLFDIFIHLFVWKSCLFLNVFIYKYFFGKKLLYFNGCYSTYHFMMVCKMAKIEELTISWISWLLDISTNALSPNMASDSTDLVPFKSCCFLKFFI